MTHCTDLFQLGDPVAHRGVVVAPLFPRRDPVAHYIPLDDALERGLRIAEVSPAGTVPELLVENRLDDDVLLYDGEELTGAKQNRILNLSVLVGARSKLPIPVSCVEQGRWRTVSAQFRSAPHHAQPDLRRRKAESLASQPLARGVAQADVWDAVRDKAHRMGVRSATAANADTFHAHTDRLRELEGEFPLQRGQCGAVLALGGEICLDAVSRPDVFARLWPKLRAGYLLDGLEHLDAPPADAAMLERFVQTLVAAAETRRPSPGKGDDVRLRGDGVLGSALELDGETIQLSGFTSRSGPRAAHGRIARPSRRR